MTLDQYLLLLETHGVFSDDIEFFYSTSSGVYGSWFGCDFFPFGDRIYVGEKMSERLLCEQHCGV